ncbi:hypothetical protein ABI59_03185 [Acidobacteria bacterium Mor1]|nr:hypothetical protein ABI59_03185 [Acidobacteria bacterium Mor1]
MNSVTRPARRFGGLAACALVLVLSAGLLEPVSAGPSLPPWAAAIKREAPPMPAIGAKEFSERVILRERSITVLPDGTFQERVRSASQVLSSLSEVSVDYFPFNQETDITQSRAWHLPPDGKKVKRSKKRDFIDIKVGDNFLNDAKARVVALPDAKRGSMMFYEFLANQRPYELGTYEFFHASVPTDMARLELTVPAGWTVEHRWLRAAGPDPRIGGGGRHYAWEMTDLQPMDDADMGPRPLEESPLLAVNVIPPAGADTIAPAFGDWKGLSVWYEELSAGMDSPSAEISTAASGLFADAGENFLDRLRVTAHFVRDKVRYVDNEVGIGGYKPRPAADTHTNLYGDCKDMGTLLQAMLATQKVEAYPVLIHATSSGTVAEDLPSLLAFNHYITAVPLPEGIEVPESVEPAVAEVEGRGRVVFVDTTDDYTSFGWISGALAGKQALLIDGEKSQIVTLPGRRPQDHRIERELLTEIGEDGGLSFERTTRYYGEHATWRRAVQARSSEDRRKLIEESIKRRWIDAGEVAYTVEPERDDGAYVEVVTWTHPTLIEAGEHTVLPMFQGAESLMPSVALGRRKVPVVYEHPQTIHFRTVVKGADPLVGLPEATEAEGDGFAVRTSFEREGDEIHGECRMELSRTRFEPDAFRALRKIYSRSKKAGGASLWFD